MMICRTTRKQGDDVVKLYIGIDPATKTGWAIWSDISDRILSAGSVQHSERYHMRNELFGAIGKAIKRINGDLSCEKYGAVEAQHVGKRTSIRTPLVVARCAGIAEGVLVGIGCNTNIWRPLATQWRSMLAWPKMSREQVKAYAKRYAEHKLGWKTPSDDEAEACCIAYALWRHHDNQQRVGAQRQLFGGSKR